MKLIAHKGLHSKNTKENTLSSILLANKNQKIDGIEFDVRLTKDNKVVVIHDKTIDRVSNGKGKVCEMTLDRLKKFNLGTFLKRERISTLDEILCKLDSSKLLIIELKDEEENNDIFASKVLTIINNYPNLNIWMKSFSSEIVNYLKKYSNIPVGIIISDKTNNIDFLDNDVDFYSISHKLINDDEISKKIYKNKPIMFWTVNTNDVMDEILNIYNNRNDIYIISDNPLIYYK